VLDYFINASKFVNTTLVQPKKLQETELRMNMRALCSNCLQQRNGEILINVLKIEFSNAFVALQNLQVSKLPYKGQNPTEHNMEGRSSPITL